MGQLLKPKNIVDIKTHSISAFSNIPKKIKLYQSRRVIDIRSSISVALISSVLFMLLFGFVSAPPQLEYSYAADTSSQRAALEAELEQLEGQIAEYEKTIEGYRKTGSTLKSEISSIEAKMKKINLQIKSVSLSLDKLSGEIKENEAQILTTEEKITLNKSAIGEAIQSVYEIEDKSLVAILLQSPNLTGFFNSINGLLDVQVSLLASVQEVTQLKEQLLTEKEELALKRKDALAFKEYQDQQRALADKAKREKDALLASTKGQEAKYQELLKETKKSAAEIRNRLFELLGGGEMTFEQAYELAKFASDATGIRAALILAVLDRESALGQNVGKCKYNENPYYPNRASNQTSMHPTRDIPVFLDITSRLGLNPDSISVSCPIPSDGAYGGAMGPAQFIPSTWKLYEKQIAQITNSNPPSPWRNSDAFVATALYLKEAYNSTGCKEYSQQIPAEAQKLRERCAVAKYYAGGNWHKFRWVYGEPVVERADGFADDIAVLNG